MKYLANGGFMSNPMVRLTLLLTLLLLFALWITNGVLYLSRMGFDPGSVAQYYLGSEEEFAHPRTFGSMLEVTHAHLATMTVVILLLTHLAVFLPLSNRWKVALILSPFASMLLSESASWLVRYASPHFAILKVIAFVSFQASLLLLLVVLGRLLLQRGPSEVMTLRHPDQRTSSPHELPRVRKG